MAITGTGTEQDPFIVHSYDELKTACLTTGMTPLYIELANDINCNDYGADFEWEAVKTSGSLGIGFDLNLKGHTIKNIKCKPQNYMFQSYNAAKIHDGKILNAFFNNAYGLSHPISNTTATTFTFENISFSLSGMGSVNSQSWDGSFAYCTKFKNCAIYYEDSASAKSSFVWTRDSAQALENCDVKVYKSGGSYSFINGNANDCRFRGKISSSTAAAKWICSGTLTNSVIDVDFSGCTGGGSSGITGGSGNPCNTNTFTEHNGISGIIVCTSTEICTGADLRAKGFTVVNVAG